MQYANLVRPNYRHTFALLVHSTGEVYTSSCDLPQYPLRTLYKRADGILREALRAGYFAHIELVNARTGRILWEAVTQ